MPYNLSRREFLAATGAGAIAILSPQSLTQVLAAPRADRRKLIRGGEFAEGVLSGDPTPRGITLLTKMTEVDAPGDVILEVARDRDFRKVVAVKKISTSDRIGHRVKARVTGLKPGERYFYRFQGRSAESSVGRFQTALPSDSNQPVKFAFFSCQEYTLGYYNAHRLLAREDVDFVVNLGDYIYGDLAMPRPFGVRDIPPLPGNKSQATTYADYCQRYSEYRADPALRAMHAKFPMISGWSDHEVLNNYAAADPLGGLTPTGSEYNYTKARQRAAYNAFFQSMPTYAIAKRRLYHKASFGRHMDLFVLDERQYREDQPCMDAIGAPACTELPQPREFLGHQQNQFLRSGLKRSKASWKVIANEVPIMGLKTEIDHYDMFDAWQGYPAEREALLQVIRKNKIKDVVFISGDYHAFIAGNVQTAAKQTVATEFVGGSITTPSDAQAKAIGGFPGYGTADEPTIPPEELARRLEANPYYKELDFLSQGYVVCEAGPRKFKATYKKLQTVRAPSLELKSAKTYVVRRGRAGL